MTDDIEMLPLPEELACEYRLLSRTGLREAVEAHARAVAEHNVKKRDAEIETLRESLDWTVEQNDRLLGEGRVLTERAERLAEALRLIAAPIRPDGTWNRDREACRQIAAEALAALNPTAAQENDDA